MSNGANTSIELMVSGDYGLFTDPITRAGGEKCSYPVPTYEALKGVLHSVYWKPTFIWHIDKVRVMNRIQMDCRGVRPIHYQDGKNDLSYYTYLVGCAYQIRAHFEWNLNRPELACDRSAQKHMSILRRSVEKGGRRDVFLGTRDCQAIVESCAFGDGMGHYDGLGTRDFGLMVHGITYPDEAYSDDTKDAMTLRMWRPVMSDGIISFPRPEQCPVERFIREAHMAVFDRQHHNFEEVL